MIETTHQTWQLQYYPDNEGSITFNMPLAKESHSKISSDFNSIRRASIQMCVRSIVVQLLSYSKSLAKIILPDNVSYFNFNLRLRLTFVSDPSH